MQLIFVVWQEPNIVFATDSFLTDFWNFWAQQKQRVPLFLVFQEGAGITHPRRFSPTRTRTRRWGRRKSVPCRDGDDFSEFIKIYRDVQLDFTTDMEVFYILFERCHTKNRKGSIKQHKDTSGEALNGNIGLSLKDRKICFLLLFYDRTVLFG